MPSHLTPNDHLTMPPLPGEASEEHPEEGWNGADPQVPTDPALVSAFAQLDYEDDEAFDEGEDDEDSPFGSLGDGPPVRRMGPPMMQRSTVGDIPIWEQYNIRKGEGFYQLRIQRMNEVGRREELGELPADAGPNHLIHRYKKPGRYLIMPVNEHGKSMLNDPKIIDIPADHPVLAELLAKPDGLRPPPMPPSMGMGGDLLNYLSKREMRELEERRYVEEKARTEQARLDESRSAVAREHADIARKSTDQATTLFTKVLEGDRDRSAQLMREQREAREAAAKRMEEQYDRAQREDKARADRMMEQQGGFFAQVLQLNNQTIERERTRLTLEAAEKRRQDEADREYRNTMVQEERRRWEARMQQERDERRQQADDRELARKEEQDRRDRASERERGRDMEHQRMMMELMKDRQSASNPLAAITTAVIAAKPVMDLLGVDVSDLGEGLRNVLAGGNDEPERGVFGELMDVAKAALTSGALGGLPALAGPPPPDYDEYLGEAEPEPAQLTYDFAAGAVAEPQGIAALAAHEANLAGGAPASANPVPPAPSTPAHPADALDSDTKRTARRALRQLIDQLTQADASTWPEVVGAAVMAGGEPVLSYLAACGITFSAREAGASAEMAAQLVTAVDAAGYGGMVPA